MLSKNTSATLSAHVALHLLKFLPIYSAKDKKS